MAAMAAATAATTPAAAATVAMAATIHAGAWGCGGGVTVNLAGVWVCGCVGL
jgi:hypothetical protein